MRCGLSPIVAMRKTKGLFIVGNKKGFAIYWEFLPFFSVFSRFPGESEPFCREFEALSPTAFQYNGHTCPSIGLARRESEPFCRESEALSPPPPPPPLPQPIQHTLPPIRGPRLLRKQPRLPRKQVHSSSGNKLCPSSLFLFYILPINDYLCRLFWD